MAQRKTLSLSRPRVAADELGYFRWGRVGEHVVITNEAGDFELLRPADFQRFLAGEIGAGDPLHQPLTAKAFIRGGDLDRVVTGLRDRKSFVGRGPHLHVAVTTLRCNQSCRYCHASRAPMDAQGQDMSIETASAMLDHALSTPSDVVNIELQGGEPTANWDVVKYLVTEGRRRNESIGKDLGFSLVSNFTLMSDEKAEFLVDHDVMVCTSLDGPQELHDWNRPWTKNASAYAEVRAWMDRFNSAWIDKGYAPRLWHVDALTTVTRKTFEHTRELVDLYVELGIRNIHLRPLNPFGFAQHAWKRIGYSIDEFLAFYEEALDYIIELNRQGVQIMEGTAALILGKMLTTHDPGYVDLQSPCGAGIGQVAYAPDGKLYPCDEARMLAADGDELFQIGELKGQPVSETLKHPTVRALAAASLQEAQPACHTCWNQPYCGVCPMNEYMTQGDIHGQRVNSRWCKRYLATSTLLLQRVADDRDGDGDLGPMFQRWIARRPRHDKELEP